MKRIALLLIPVLAVLTYPGCKDAPLDPESGTPVVRNDTTKGRGGPVDTTTCIGCYGSTRRQVFPYVAFAVKLGSDTAWVNLLPEGPIIPHKVSTYSNGTPKLIDLKMTFMVPFSFYTGVKDIWRVQLCLNESLPFGTLKSPSEVKTDPWLGFTGLAISYRHSSGQFQRLSTGDVIAGQGPGQGHSEAQLKYERIDTANRTISLWIKDMKFVIPGTDPVKYVNPAPIYMKIPY